MNVKWTKRFWAFAGAAFLSFSASAAEAQSPAPIWTGFYIGVHGGGGWGETSDEGIELGGGLGGLHGGYQWQSGAFVLRAEGDVSFGGGVEYKFWKYASARLDVSHYKFEDDFERKF
jgi:outer membrane immunogenic protein